LFGKNFLAIRDSRNAFHQLAPQFFSGVRSAWSRPVVENLISRDQGRALRGEKLSFKTILPAASAL
jgi:hypothetical protein